MKRGNKPPIGGPVNGVQGAKENLKNAEKQSDFSEELLNAAEVKNRRNRIGSSKMGRLIGNLISWGFILAGLGGLSDVVHQFRTGTPPHFLSIKKFNHMLETGGGIHRSRGGAVWRQFQHRGNA